MMEFSQELYREHLEEGAFLYDQRGALFTNPELSWIDLEDYEQRLNAHADALVVGSDLALDVCREQALAGDPGELHMASRVFCRQDRYDLLVSCLQDLTTDDTELLRAVRNALNHELPPKWGPHVEAMLVEGTDIGLAVFAKVAGYLRLDLSGHLIGTLKRCADPMLHAVIWALGRIRKPEAHNAIMAYLTHSNPHVCADAAFSLLRMGDNVQTSQWLDRISVRDGRVLAIGLGAQRDRIGTILSRIEGGKANNDCPVALGMLGDIAAVDPLIELMTEEALATSSALALNMILGADLYTDVFVPDEPDPDELFDDEFETTEKVQPAHGNAAPAGTTVEMLIEQPDMWRQWWNANRTRFQSNICFRQGQPYSPKGLLDILKAPGSPRMLRQIAYEELVIRYGLDIPFEPDMFVRRQKKALDQYEILISQRQNEFKPGHWYFGGRKIS